MKFRTSLSDWLVIGAIATVPTALIAWSMHSHHPWRSYWTDFAQIALGSAVWLTAWVATTLMFAAFFRDDQEWLVAVGYFGGMLFTGPLAASVAWQAIG